MLTMITIVAGLCSYKYLRKDSELYHFMLPNIELFDTILSITPNCLESTKITSSSIYEETNNKGIQTPHKILMELFMFLITFFFFDI